MLEKDSVTRYVTEFDNLSKSNQAIIKAYKIGYRGDEYGNIYDPKGLRVKLSLNTSGYFIFRVPIFQSRVTVYAHRFLAYCWFGDQLFQPSILVRHLNDYPQHNYRENLALGTHTDNRLDIPKIVRDRIASKARSFIHKI